jgi:ABC-type Fe3+/spermidine/putrescine transport system ATPase subunit
MADPGTVGPVMVRLDRITKRYPGQAEPAVADLSFTIDEGEFFSLLGPSGCGKTTTLRIVAGLEMPDSGSIHFRDRPIVVMSDRLFVPPEKREIGMVFQSYAIWPHMTVEENIAYPLKLRKLGRAERLAAVERALALVGLQELAKQPAPLLSGGQQQRVALARALVYQPGLLLLDEPFSNLDSKLREQMRVEVKLLQARLKITVLLVTHDQVEALSLSNRVAVLDQGKVQQVGRPRDLYERPANAFVRDFLGNTVVLRGTVREADAGGHLTIAVDGAANCVVYGRMPPLVDRRAGDAVFLAMRPEDAKLMPANGSTPPGANVVLGTVEASLFVGGRTDYRIKVDGQGSILIYGDRRDTYEDGSVVWVRLPSDGLTIWPT